jgi:hypothetical protein
MKEDLRGQGDEIYSPIKLSISLPTSEKVLTGNGFSFFPG